MKVFFETSKHPSQVQNIRLEVNSSTSLMITFDEPVVVAAVAAAEQTSFKSAPLIIKYLGV